MGVGAQQQVLRVLLAAAALAWAPAALPAADPGEAPAVPAADAGERATAALRSLASAYSQKRRSLFMKAVSDDFSGDLGTLEDALSSDFRSYRTIDLSIVPAQVTVNGAKAQVAFRFDLNVTDDLGKTTKFSGSAVYTFVDEDGKSKLLQMDRVPIFGTSLSSIENPIPKSQGAPTAAVANAPGGCGSTVTGSAVVNAETSPQFNFAAQTASSSGGDIAFSPGLINAVGSAALADLGPCNFTAFSQDPSTISDSSESAAVGECYAVRTTAGKFAAFVITSFPPSAMAIQFKFQPSGQRCF